MIRIILIGLLFTCFKTIGQEQEFMSKVKDAEFKKILENTATLEGEMFFADMNFPKVKKSITLDEEQSIRYLKIEKDSLYAKEKRYDEFIEDMVYGKTKPIFPNCYAKFFINDKVVGLLVFKHSDAEDIESHNYLYCLDFSGNLLSKIMIKLVVSPYDYTPNYFAFLDKNHMNRYFYYTGRTDNDTTHFYCIVNKYKIQNNGQLVMITRDSIPMKSSVSTYLSLDKREKDDPMYIFLKEK